MLSGDPLSSQTLSQAMRVNAHLGDLERCKTRAKDFQADQRNNEQVCDITVNKIVLKTTGRLKATEKGLRIVVIILKEGDIHL